MGFTLCLPCASQPPVLSSVFWGTRATPCVHACAHTQLVPSATRNYLPGGRVQGPGAGASGLPPHAQGFPGERRLGPGARARGRRLPSARARRGPDRQVTLPTRGTYPKSHSPLHGDVKLAPSDAVREAGCARGQGAALQTSLLVSSPDAPGPPVPEHSGEPTSARTVLDRLGCSGQPVLRHVAR